MPTSLRGYLPGTDKGNTIRVGWEPSRGHKLEQEENREEEEEEVEVSIDRRFVNIWHTVLLKVFWLTLGSTLIVYISQYEDDWFGYLDSSKKLTHTNCKLPPKFVFEKVPPLENKNYQQDFFFNLIFYKCYRDIQLQMKKDYFWILNNLTLEFFEKV